MNQSSVRGIEPPKGGGTPRRPVDLGAVFVDVMIFRDVLGNRRRQDGYPLFASSVALLRTIATKGIGPAYTSPLALVGAAAEAKKSYASRPEAERVAMSFIHEHILPSFTIVSIDDGIIDKALKNSISELEDRIIYYSAEKAGCSCLITRNIWDLRPLAGKNIRVLRPEDIIGYPHWSPPFRV